MIKKPFPLKNTEVYYTDNFLSLFNLDEKIYRNFSEISILTYSESKTLRKEFPYYLLDVGWKYILPFNILMEPSA
jgi:hypothetical protein